MQSCIYAGRVRHRRIAPRPHAFSYGLFMIYLDLDELDSVFRGRWLWSARRPALAWFRRADHVGDESESLAETVRRLVEARCGQRPRGPVRLLTHLRYFGYQSNPVSFYYCFDEAGAEVEAVVAEVTNTPWGERHCYVLGYCENQGTPAHRRYELAKRMHVSPFMPMDIDYNWRLSRPGRRLSVHIENHRGGAKLFDATLSLQRRDISASALAWTLIRFPLMTAQVTAGIYFEALLLWLKRIPFCDHPDHQEAPPATKDS